MMFRGRDSSTPMRRVRSRAAALAGALAIALAASPVAAQSGGAGLIGTWRGTYTCYQGLTALELVVEPAVEGVDARFVFSAHPSNPRVPSGSFRMAGRIDAKSGRFVFEPREWFDQPEGYVMVGLEGVLARDGNSLSGRVIAEGCTVFALSRAGK